MTATSEVDTVSGSGSVDGSVTGVCPELGKVVDVLFPNQSNDTVLFLKM